jgi:hypothetical protein
MPKNKSKLTHPIIYKKRKAKNTKKRYITPLFRKRNNISSKKSLNRFRKVNE